MLSRRTCALAKDVAQSTSQISSPLALTRKERLSRSAELTREADEALAREPIQFRVAQRGGQDAVAVTAQNRFRCKRPDHRQIRSGFPGPINVDDHILI